MEPNRHAARPRRSPSLAAALSFLWPGLGQFYVGRRRVAAFFAVPALLLLALALREALQGPVALALSMVSPSYAAAVFILIVLFGVWRAWSLVHAYAAGARSVRPKSRMDGGILSLLLIAILVMHSVPAYMAYLTYQLDTQISKPIDNDQAWTLPEETPDPSAIPSFEMAPGASFTPAPTPRHNSNRVTILLVGIDFGPGRNHALTDTMLLVSLDKDTKKVVMVSVPRDTTMFELYWNHATLGPTFKLNALTTAVANKWFVAPDSPMETLQKEVGYLMGVQVDYYAALDLTGFEQVIDMVGGVDVVIPKSFYDPLEKIQWLAGPVHLNGERALKYVRSRYADNDYARASRQQDVLMAFEKKVTTPSMLVRLPDFLSTGGKIVRTNYPLDQAKDMAVFGQDIGKDAITQCVLGSPYSYHPDSSTTNGVWTSRLRMDQVANLSASLFGQDSAYYGQPGVKAAPCGK